MGKEKKQEMVSEKLGGRKVEKQRRERQKKGVRKTAKTIERVF